MATLPRNADGTSKEEQPRVVIRLDGIRNSPEPKMFTPERNTGAAGGLRMARDIYGRSPKKVQVRNFGSRQAGPIAIYDPSIRYLQRCFGRGADDRLYFEVVSLRAVLLERGHGADPDLVPAIDDLRGHLGRVRVSICRLCGCGSCGSGQCDDAVASRVSAATSLGVDSGPLGRRGRELATAGRREILERRTALVARASIHLFPRLGRAAGRSSGAPAPAR